jgi:nucleoid-associated protein YgaU
VDAVENVTVAGYAKLKTLMNIRKTPGGELVTTYKAKVIVAVVEFGGDGWLKILCPESDTGIAYVSNENGEYAFVGSSVYIVQRGDNVWKIAEEQLGDGTRCDEISTLNTLVSNRIQVGMELLLP